MFQNIRAVQNALLQIQGVTKADRGGRFRLEVISEEQRTQIAQILNLPENAYLGTSQFLGALSALGLDTDKQLGKNTVKHVVHINNGDFPKLFPGLNW